MLLEFLDNLLNLFLDTAIWLLFGLILAAILKGWIPSTLVKKWLSGKGPGGVIRAAFIGAPLPLCSCGVLPTAIGLRRSGASKPATVSFLVATPETGVDSISVTYALLGPAMAIIRPVSAVFSAIVSGMMILIFDRDDNTSLPTTDVKPASCGCSKKEKMESSCCSPKEEIVSSCCSTKEEADSGCSNEQQQASKSCCSKQEKNETSCCKSEASEETERSAGSGCCSEQSPSPRQSGLMAGLRFAIIEILDDISKWLAAGLVLAAIIATLVEPASLSQWGSGLTGMLLMLVVGLPLYICATASTPLAASLLAAGMSPGAILVFLLVGPATNIASLGILTRELGVRAVIIYLCGISICAVALGLATDAILTSQSLSIGTSMGYHDSQIYMTIKWTAAIILFLLAVKPLRQLFWRTEAPACA